MESWRINLSSFLTFLLPPAIYLLAFFVAPLAIVWVLSFGETLSANETVITWTLDNYARAVEPLHLGIFWKSIRICGIATLACLIVGYPVAFMIAFTKSTRLKAVLLLLVILPFAINILVRTYALIAVFRANGVINTAYEWLWTGAHAVLSVVGMGDALLGDYWTPLALLYSNTGVVLGIVYVFFPFMVLPLYANIEKIDRSYIEASLDLGASQLQTFWRVILPQTWHGILSGVIIVFIPALGYFFIPEILGGANSDLIGNVIQRQFMSANDWPFGAALSFLLMYATFIAIALRAYVGSKRGRAL
jgi:spermidine/putrescine transport system permease protein